MKLAQQCTVKQLWQYACKVLWSERRYVESGWVEQVESLWRAHVSALGNYKVKNLTGAMIRAWHGRKADTPYAINRALATLSVVLDLACQEGEIPANPARGVRRHREKKRSQHAARELPRLLELFEELRASEPKTIALLRAVLFTGARPKSLLGFESWQATTVEGGWGRFEHVGKASGGDGIEDVLMIPPEILREVDAVGGLPLSLSHAQYVWRQYIQPHFPGLWLRDLRRTFATLGMSQPGVSMSGIGELLNHRSVQTTMRYAKLLDGSRLRLAGAVVEELRKGERHAQEE